ncbi:hypothetical protein EHS25_002360 [Saitozyma podzolica]|uniref:WLM domain-containing protein n=1 Tax=Saitozyma podzolica TaxID=1890683 RepID=A0A427YDU1_9TREE|nr:hypothetical protein EHS25_002360 [Saitozyma podzolica]
MSLIGRFEHLRNRPRSDEAGPLLEKIASQVKPIMAKRGWKVGVLAEFLPANPALLGNNMNAGERINLRLRPPGNTSTFYEYDQLVLVMLHELTHIEQGPHDARFYKILGELEEEFYELKRKGYAGEGFHGTGHHLSGFKVPEHVGKAKGLAAAEKRLATQRKIGKGGVLGGSGTGGKTMKEVIAEAAERRIRDDKACNTADEGHAKEVEAEIRKAAEESEGVDAKDLPSEDGEGPAPTSSTGLIENSAAQEGQGVGKAANGPISTKTADRRVSPRPLSSRSQPYPASSSNGASSASVTTSGARPAVVAPKRSTTTSAAKTRIANQPGTTPIVAKRESAPIQHKDPDPVQLLQLDTGEWACPTSPKSMEKEWEERGGGASSVGVGRGRWGFGAAESAGG